MKHETFNILPSERQGGVSSPRINQGDSTPLGLVIIWDGGYWKDMFPFRGSRIIKHGCFLGIRWFNHALKMCRALRQRRYDIFISFQPEEWPLLLFGVGAGTSIGVFDTFLQGEQRRETSKYCRLYTKSYTAKNLPFHRTDQYLLPLDALGIPRPVDKQMTIGFTSPQYRVEQINDCQEKRVVALV